MNSQKWKITKKILEDTLIKSNKYSSQGLLLENFEFGGVIKFENHNCRVVEGEIICDKSYNNHTIEKGNSNSVSTPVGHVNFHTHPLHCYISGKVIWGWPSGEDMGQCIRFAQFGNLYHIVFSLEGTYVVIVNKRILNLTEANISSIETIFKLTHKYRMYKNSTELYEEFKAFIKLCGLSPVGSNTLELWIYFVNNFKIGHCGYYTDPINIMNPDLKAFKVFLFKNKSIQHEDSPRNAYELLKNVKTSSDLNNLIKIPKEIQLKL